jgi:hypothetical protein
MKIKLPWTASVFIILIGAFLVVSAIIWVFQKYSLVVLLQNSAADFVVVLLFTSAGSVLIQLGFRSMSDQPHDPTRHIVSSWVLYPVGIFWALLSLLVIVEGSLYGLIPLSIGMLILIYAYKRPAARDPKPFIRLEMPIEHPNLWTQLFIGKKVHYVLFGGYFIAWIFPWEIVSYIPMHQEFVNYLIPHLLGLRALHQEASNPEFAVGMMSFMVILSPIVLLITLTKSQTADRVVSGEYPIKDAWKTLLLGLITLPMFIDVYIKVPGSDTAIQNLIRESNLALSLQQVSYLWIGNAILILILSMARGVFGYYRQGVSR